MSTHNTRTAIATTTCLTFGVAVAVALGAIPRPAGNGSPTVPLTGVLSAASHHGVAPTAHRAAHVASGPTVSTPTATPSSASNPSTTAGSAPTVPVPAGLVANVSSQTTGSVRSPLAANVARVSGHHRRHHHHRRRHHHSAPTTPTTTTPKLAPRVKPSSAAVSAAISGLRQYVNSPFTPSASQVASFGNDVCTAFDDNHSYAAVIAEVEQKVQQIPFTSLKPGGADYVVKTAVKLYCPGYTSRLS